MNGIEKLLPILSYLRNDLIIETNEIPGNILYVLKECFNSIRSTERDSRNLGRIQSVLDILWEDLNTGHWSNVPEISRQLYSIASLLKIAELIKDAQYSSKWDLKEAIKAADLGLLLGSSCRIELSNAATLINQVIYKDKFRSDRNNDVRQETTPKESNCFVKVPTDSIEQLDCPSLQYFSQHYFNPELPVKLINCISHWPAFKKWNDISYLKEIAGSRTVPVELGSSYTQEDWGMKLLTLDQFIENHIYSNSEKIGYLAQHQLFDQIPELKRDICIPEYCCLSKNENSEDVTDINAWFGPKGTITPLHYDPKHNLLTQVVGRKQILLYSPEETDNLYPHESRMLHNTSRVDPQNPDYESFPRYKKAKGFMCILNPGDQLYIPPKWWHYVKSLNISFSVSFWWE